MQLRAQSCGLIKRKPFDNTEFIDESGPDQTA